MPYVRGPLKLVLWFSPLAERNRYQTNWEYNYGYTGSQPARQTNKLTFLGIIERKILVGFTVGKEKRKKKNRGLARNSQPQ